MITLWLAAGVIARQAAAGDATANGVVLSYSHSLIDGAATGTASATATGQTLAFTHALIDGAATGQQNATATGAVLPFSHSLLDGAASGTSDGTATGAVLSLVYSLQPGTASGEELALRSRGDDGGVRERFWRAKAEEWLQDQLEAVERAVKAPQRARKRLATRIVAEVPRFVSEIPEFAPRVSDLDALLRQLMAPQPDHSAIAEAVARQMALIEAWNTIQRRRRDMEAILVLAA